jgi:hypothetical protein
MGLIINGALRQECFLCWCLVLNLREKVGKLFKVFMYLLHGMKRRLGLGKYDQVTVSLACTSNLLVRV